MTTGTIDQRNAASATGRTPFDVYRGGGTTVEISFLVKMVIVVRSFRSLVDERLRAIGQSATRMEALGAIANMKGAKSQKDLANRLRLESPTITRIIDILSAEGLVERHPDLRDRRINLLSISPAGEEALAEIFKVYDEIRAHVLEGLSEQEMKDTIVILDRLLERLDTPVGALQPAD